MAVRNPVPDRAYRTLDGLRGVAALIVVTRHVGGVARSDLCPESFLAVDLFFLLSGFVIAYAYEQRLLAGARTGWFLRTRLQRLYPLYALGIALGAMAHLTQAWSSGQPVDVRWLGQALAVGLLLLPNCPPLPMGSSALDGPTWTLLPELLANLLYARLVRRLGVRTLVLMVAAGAAALAACERAYGTLDGGWWVGTFALIGARLLFSFFLGVLMFRFRPERRIGPAAALGCLVALALVLAGHPPEAWRRAYEFLAVVALFPAIVAVAVRREPGRRSAPVYAGLGLASYAAYVLHEPLGELAGEALRRTLGHPLPPLAGFGLFLPAVVAVSMLADRLYDRPARRWLAGLKAPRLGLPRLRPA